MDIPASGEASSAAFSFAQPLYCVSVPNFCSVWNVKGTQHWLSSLLLVLPLARLEPLLKPVWGQTAETPGFLWALAQIVGSPWLPSLFPHEMYLELNVFSLTRKKKINPFSTWTCSVLDRGQPTHACTSGHCSHEWLWFTFQVVLLPRQYIWIALEGGAMSLLNGTSNQWPQQKTCLGLVCLRKCFVTQKLYILFPTASITLVEIYFLKHHLYALGS